jgi:hypothetical protein
VRPRETTSFQVKLKPGDSSSDPNGTSNPNSNSSISLGYMFGGSAGTELGGAGFTGMFEFGIHGGRWDVGVRLGEMGSLRIYDVLLRFAILDTRLTPVFTAGYSYASNAMTDTAGNDTSVAGGGGVFGAGLRVNVMPKSSTAIYLSAGPELRTYSGVGDSAFFPLMASIQITYGKTGP